jgi:hypothetical protein
MGKTKAHLKKKWGAQDGFLMFFVVSLSQTETLMLDLPTCHANFGN